MQRRGRWFGRIITSANTALRPRPPSVCGLICVCGALVLLLLLWAGGQTLEYSTLFATALSYIKASGWSSGRGALDTVYYRGKRGEWRHVPRSSGWHCD